MRARIAGIGARWPALALVAALAGGPARGQAPAAPAAARELSAAEQEVVRALRAVRAKQPPPVAGLLERIQPHAAGTLELLVTILSERRVPSVDGLAVQRLSIAQADLALAALADLGRERALPAFLARAAASDGPGAPAAAIELLGVIGDVDDLGRAVALAREGADGELDMRTHDVLARAVAAILARDPRAFDRLGSAARNASRAVLASVVAGVGATKDARGLAFLAELLTWRDDLAADALAQIPAIGPGATREVDLELAELARDHLDPAAPQRCRAALLALGTLEDERSVGIAIELLEHESAGMRANAAWALERIACLSGLAPDAWRSWHAAEERWYERERPRCVADLGAADLGRVSAAMRALSQHRLYRHDVAADLARALADARPDVRWLAANALGDLGSRVALDALRTAARDDDARVAAAAQAALDRLSRPAAAVVARAE